MKKAIKFLKDAGIIPQNITIMPAPTDDSGISRVTGSHGVLSFHCQIFSTSLRWWGSFYQYYITYNIYFYSVVNGDLASSLSYLLMYVYTRTGRLHTCLTVIHRLSLGLSILFYVSHRFSTSISLLRKINSEVIRQHVVYRWLADAENPITYIWLKDREMGVYGNRGP